MMVLGISGSPRLLGNTDQLLAEVLRGARSEGAEIKTVTVCDLDIAPCQHCDSCLRTGECKINDDMQSVYGDMEDADAIVLASPLHFMGVTAQMKALIDRCQSRWARKYRLKVPPLGDKRQRQGLFVSVGGRDVANLFDGARTTVKTLFASLDVEYAGELLFAGIAEAGASARHPTALKQAYRAGQKLAK
jgi:multimeric flavodoxin WrbA